MKTPQTLKPYCLPNFGLSLSFKQEFRWLFEFITKNDKTSTPHYNKRIQMPILKYENGHKKWTPMIVEIYDVANQNNEIWEWINSTEFGEQTVGSIKYLNGCGEITEELILQIVPIEVKMSDLDYKKSEESVITIVFDVKSVERIVAPIVNCSTSKIEKLKKCLPKKQNAV